LKKDLFFLVIWGFHQISIGYFTNTPEPNKKTGYAGKSFPFVIVSI